jgi:hypothetical protein
VALYNFCANFPRGNTGMEQVKSRVKLQAWLVSILVSADLQAKSAPNRGFVFIAPYRLLDNRARNPLGDATVGIKRSRQAIR